MKLPPYFTTKVEPWKSWMYGHRFQQHPRLGCDLGDIHRRSKSVAARTMTGRGGDCETVG